MRPLRRRALSTAPSPLRFEEPLESEFRADFDRVGRSSRSELWLIMLVVIALALVFNRVFLDVPPEVLPLGRFLVVAVLVPMVLRWLSSARSPLRRWSSWLFIVSVYLDVGAMMSLRVACLDNGIDVVPLVMPVAVLMSLIVVQIRFALVAPAILLGLVEIIAIELLAFDSDSNRLFGITAATALVTVALSAAYDLERWTRIGWMRQRELDALARTDPLTGLPNRRHFGETLRSLAEAKAAIVVMILDVDRFKSYNDRFGHPAGDACLRAVGEYLASAVAANGFVARLGGEEFAAVWVDAGDLDQADELRRGMSAIPLEPMPGTSATITASAGLARSRAGSNSEAVVAELFSRADAALYAAKRTGRDKLVVYDGQEPGFRERYGEVRDRQPEVVVEQPMRWSLRFEPPLEAEFRESFEAQGRSSRRLIMIGLLCVIVLILIFQEPLLKIPPEADKIGRLTLICGLMPGALLALAGNSLPRLARWAPEIYIAGVAIVITAQLFERWLQLPRGYDVVPMVMPLSVLLSLTVVQIRFTLLAPAAVAGLIGLCVTELALYPTTGNRLLEVGACIVMIGVTLRFSYKLERSRRLGWRRERRLDELTRTDALTGLINRRQFDQSLSELVESAARSRVPVVLAIIDIDYFKSYNDALGHIAGDECLRVVGRYLSVEAQMWSGFAARLGGEEFAIAWLDVDGQGAQAAERVRSGLATLPITPLRDFGPVTASAGIVVAPVQDSSAFAHDLHTRADAALYTAKHAGRDRSTVIDLERVE